MQVAKGWPGLRNTAHLQAPAADQGGAPQPAVDSCDCASCIAIAARSPEDKEANPIAAAVKKALCKKQDLAAAAAAVVQAAALDQVQNLRILAKDDCTSSAESQDAKFFAANKSEVICEFVHRPLTVLHYFLWTFLTDSLFCYAAYGVILEPTVCNAN